MNKSLFLSLILTLSFFSSAVCPPAAHTGIDDQLLVRSGEVETIIVVLSDVAIELLWELGLSPDSRDAFQCLGVVREAMACDMVGFFNEHFRAYWDKDPMSANDLRIFLLFALKTNLLRVFSVTQGVVLLNAASKVNEQLRKSYPVLNDIEKKPQKLRFVLNTPLAEYQSLKPIVQYLVSTGCPISGKVVTDPWVNCPPHLMSSRQGSPLLGSRHCATPSPVPGASRSPVPGIASAPLLTELSPASPVFQPRSL